MNYADPIYHEEKYKLSNDIFIHLCIQDTMGQNSRFHSLYFNKYPLANSVILMYDIKNKESFENCNYYVEKIKELCDKDIEVILLGNDQSNSHLSKYERQVSIEEGEKFSKSNNFKFMEISTNTKEGIIEAFEIAIWMALNNKRKRDNLKSIESYNKLKEKKNCLIV